MKTTIFSGLLALLIVSCKPAEIAINPQLNAQAMSVKGRNGFLIGQKIKYGVYHTDKVQRGWTQGYDVPFMLRFQGAKEKLRFKQYGPEGISAEVSCVSKFKNVELPILGEFFGIPLDYRNFFAGNIRVGDAYWDFILHNPNGDFLREKKSAGMARYGDHVIEINAVRGLKNQPEWMKDLTVFGHEFSINGKVIGAVSTVNRGTVWIDESLDATHKTVLAALATGILLRTDVEGVDMQAAR
ncbi:MAG: hypothetical protein SFV22_05775 [Saprospiraceae bacterium]|nr:hypothetical protein [Saprospiraceae bacterium]